VTTAPVDAARLSRAAHRTMEPLHVIGYFAPETAQNYVAAGLKGSRRGYVASRVAPLGPVPSSVVRATFYNFSPAVIDAAIPSAWEVVDPASLLAARYAGIDAAYRRVLGDDVLAGDEMAEAAELARTATTALDVVGRPLYAAYAALDWPEPAHLVLFHAQTLLREHRGDGHIAALVLAGLDPVEALVVEVARGSDLPEDVLKLTRGWTDEQWAAGVARLAERGLLEGTSLTETGAALREDVEVRTDVASAAPWALLGEERTARLRQLTRPWSKAIVASMFGGTS
jgi:hypothetical protein